jgi:hypothetical protein
MPEYKAKAYFRAGGPKVNIEQMRKHCDDVAEAVTSGVCIAPFHLGPSQNYTLPIEKF